MGRVFPTIISFGRQGIPRSVRVDGSGVPLDRLMKGRAERPEGRIRAHEKSRCRKGDQDDGSEPNGRGRGRRGQLGDLHRMPPMPVR